MRSKRESRTCSVLAYASACSGGIVLLLQYDASLFVNSIPYPPSPSFHGRGRMVVWSKTCLAGRKESGGPNLEAESQVQCKAVVKQQGGVTYAISACWVAIQVQERHWTTDLAPDFASQHWTTSRDRCRKGSAILGGKTAGV